MPNAEDYFSGKYATASQFPKDRHITAVITRVTEEVMQITNDNKLVLYLSTPTGKAHSKGVVLNKTNGTAMINAFGSDTDLWVGKQIELWAASTSFAGKPTMGIRIMPVGNGHSTAMPAAAAPSWEAPGGSDLNDEVPW